MPDAFDTGPRRSDVELWRPLPILDSAMLPRNMLKTAVALVAYALLAAAACGSDDGANSCVGENTFSTTKTGGSCQVNIFSTPERAVYCAKNAAGSYACLCGAAVDNPTMFVSNDICDLEADARVCQAVSRCGFSF